MKFILSGWNLRTKKTVAVLFVTFVFVTTLQLLIHTHRKHEDANTSSAANTDIAIERRPIIHLDRESKTSSSRQQKVTLRRWLEDEGIYTNESSNVDLVRQASFRMIFYKPELKLDELLAMTPGDLESRLDVFGILKSSIASQQHTFLASNSNPYVVSRMSDAYWYKSDGIFDVAIVFPFDQNQLPKLRVLLQSWNEYPPCSESWRIASKSTQIHFVFAYTGSFSSSDGKVVAASLQRMWDDLGTVNQCFASVNFQSLKQPGKFSRLDAMCISFHVLMHMFHNTPLAAMQIMDSDTFPIRAHWLEEFADFADPSRACSDWWVKGSPSMCKTISSPLSAIDIQRDFHINGNALFALNCPAFEDFLVRIQLYYPARPDKGWQAKVAGGCETGKPNQGGYEYAMYDYRNKPENYIFARRHLDKFQYAYFLVNHCEDIYNLSEVRLLDPRTQMVHSNSAFLSYKTKHILEAFANALERPPVRTELQGSFMKLLPLLYSGELHRYSLSRIAQVTVANRMEPPQEFLTSASWKDAFPGKFYIWTADLHAGPISCQLPVFTDAGAVVHAETDYEDCGVYGYCKKRLRVLSNNDKLAFSLESGGRPSSDLKKSFFLAYKHDPEFARVNAFFCSYPVSNCQLFMPFKKPIIIYTTTRLEFGRHDNGLHWRLPKWTKSKGEEEWQKWVDDLKQLARSPNNIIAASNLYDVAYIKYFTGLDAQYIPAWCGDCNADYERVRVGESIYQPHPEYLPVKNSFLIGSHRTNLNLLRNGSSVGSADDHPIMQSLGALLETRGNTATVVSVTKEFPTRHSKSDLCRYLGIIMVPYQVSTMSIVEYYRMNIPLFFPSVSLLIEWHERYGLMWEIIYGWPDRHSPREDLMVPNPNEDSAESFAYWVEYADWYNMPHIQLFHNFSHLADLLETVDLQKISSSMEQFNRIERTRLVGTWQAIFDKLS